jgi:putative spermidine/putrescine transport system permease protein
LGLIQTPADFPILVKDRSGIGIILDYVTKEIPFLTLIVLAVLRSQAENLDIVAENLGASRWQRLWYITIPQVLPSLMAGSLSYLGLFSVPMKSQPYLAYDTHVCCQFWHWTSS